MRKNNKIVKNVYFKLLVLQLCFASFDTLGYAPLGGYINHEKLTISGCFSNLDLYDYRFESVVFFEDNNIPDSVLIEFGDSKPKFVKLKKAELLCDGLIRCSYETIHQFFWCGIFIVNVKIDDNTFFSGKNISINNPFILQTVVTLSPLTVPDVANHLFTSGLVNFYPGLRLSLAIETEFIDSMHYSINTKHTTTPDNCIEINAETGDIIIKQLPDTGLYLFIIQVKEYHESGHLKNTHYVYLNVHNSNISNNLSYQDSLQTDGFGILKSNLNSGDTLNYQMYFNSKTIDSLKVNLVTKIPFNKKPNIEILKLNDSIKIKSTFYMDNECYKILPQTVLFHFMVYEQGNCTDFYSSFYFAPENYYPLGISNSKVKRELFLFPNPTNGLIHLDPKYYFFNLSEITIFDISGIKMKYRYKADQLNISDLPPGIYFVFINHDDNYYTQKIIKEN